MTDLDALLLVNARFYEAFEDANLDVLDEVWSHAEDVWCIHPGWGRVTGWKDVRKSWEGIFAAGERFKFSLRNVSARIREDVGVVLLEEEIVLGNPSVPQVVRAIATNLFEKSGTSWKMIHHHASPIMMSAGDDRSYRYN